MGPKPTPKALPRLKAQSGTRRSAAKAELRLQLQNGSAAPNKIHLSKLKGFGSQPYGPPRGDGRRHRSPRRAGIQRWEWERGGWGGGSTPGSSAKRSPKATEPQQKDPPGAVGAPKAHTEWGRKSPPPATSAAPHQSGPASKRPRARTPKVGAPPTAPEGFKAAVPFVSMPTAPPPPPPRAKEQRLNPSRTIKAALLQRGCAANSAPKGAEPPRHSAPLRCAQSGAEPLRPPTRRGGGGGAALPPPPLSIHVG